MAVIPNNSLQGSGRKTLTEVTLTASDTFTYFPGTGQVIRFRNTTAGALTASLVGDQATIVVEAGGFAANYASGYTTNAIPATTGDLCIPLDSIPGFLAGTVVTVTGASGLKCCLTGY